MTVELLEEAREALAKARDMLDRTRVLAGPGTLLHADIVDALLEVNAVLEPPTLVKSMRAAIDAAGWELKEVTVCSMQGAIVACERPVAPGETFLGIPVSGTTHSMEWIERHFYPTAVAPAPVQTITLNRACQRVIWDAERAIEEAKHAG